MIPPSENKMRFGKSTFKLYGKAASLAQKFETCPKVMISSNTLKMIKIKQVMFSLLTFDVCPVRQLNNKLCTLTFFRFHFQFTAMCFYNIITQR